MRRLLATLLLWPILASGQVSWLQGVSAVNPLALPSTGIIIANTGCVNIEDAGGTSIGVLCLDASDDLQIGDGTGVNNLDFTVANEGVFTFLSSGTPTADAVLWQFGTGDSATRFTIDEDGDGIFLGTVTATAHRSTFNTATLGVSGTTAYSGNRIEIARTLAYVIQTANQVDDSAPLDISVIAGAALAAAATNLDGADLNFTGGAGASGSAGDADGGGLNFTGGAAFGTGDGGTFTFLTPGTPTANMTIFQVGTGDEADRFHIDEDGDINAGSNYVSQKTTLNFDTTGDLSATDKISFNSGATQELTDSDGRQAFFAINPTINQSSTGAYDGLYVNVTETATGDGSTGDGNNLLNLAIGSTSFARVSNTASLFLTEKANADADVAAFGQLWVKTETPNALFFTDDTGVDHDLTPPVFKSYTFVARDAASGENFQAGYYDYPTTDVTLTIGGSVTQTHGGANAPYGAHAFAVASGAGGTDLVLTVTGTSITDAGVRDAGGTEIIVADADTASTDDYFETTLKWIGTITYTLTGSSGAFTFNYGYAKSEDFGNRDFIVTDFESVGLANANDAGFDIELLHHQTTGWTYAASGFKAGSDVITAMNATYSTEQDIDSGEPFAFKRTGLSTSISASGVEGVVIRVTTGANNSVSYMDSHLGITVQ